MKILKYNEYLNNLKDDPKLFESFDTGIPEPGDHVVLVNKRRSKLMTDAEFEFITSKKSFEITKVKKNEKGSYLIDIGYVNPESGHKKLLLFSRFKIVEPPIVEREGFVNIHLSKALIDNLREIKNNPIPKFILGMRYGISKELVKEKYLDYLDTDKKVKGAITFVNNQEVGEAIPIKEVWTSKRRQSSSILKVLRRIFDGKYMDELDKEWTKRLEGRGNTSYAETFAHEWKLLFDNELRIEVLYGPDILRTFNFQGTYDGVKYTSEIDLKTFDMSCANFTNADQGNVERYDMYVKNPQSIGMVTAFRKGKIVGRAQLFKGVNLIENGIFKKGVEYGVVNNAYTERDPKIRAAISKWAADNGYYENNKIRDILFIPFKTRVTNVYPPIDGIGVSVKDDILATRVPQERQAGKIYRNFHNAYRLNVGRIAADLKLKMKDYE